MMTDAATNRYRVALLGKDLFASDMGLVFSFKDVKDLVGCSMQITKHYV